MNLKIQVLGSGMIPRGYGLAPRKAPFNADLTLIATIMNTPGLKVNFLNPESQKFVTLTPQNLKRFWAKYSNWDSEQLKKAEAAATATENDGTAPHVPGIENGKNDETPVNPPQESPKVEEPKNDPPVPPAVDEDKKPEETPSHFTPAINDDEPKKDEAPIADGDVPPAVEEKNEEKSDEPKDSTPAGGPTPMKTMYNNGQKKDKRK